MARYTTAQLFGSGPPGDDEVGAYIIEAARKRGIPEEDALSVWAGEGRGAWQSSVVKNGRRERSYGPFQLYMDGGLGNKFQEETGLDPSDPATWKQGVDYALDTAANEGWRQWYGAPAHLRARGGYEPLRVSPPTSGKKRYSTQELFAKPEPPQEAPAPEPPQAAAPEPVAEPPKAPPPHTPWGDIAEDAMNSLTSATIGAGVTLAGLPGEIEKYGNKFSRYLNPDVQLTEYLPTIEDVEKKVKGTIGDYDYTPKTGAGEVVKFVPAVAAGGVSKLGTGIKAFAPSARGAAQITGGALSGALGEEVGGVPGAIIGTVAGSRVGAKPVPAGKAPKITDADNALAEADQVMGPGTAAVKRVSQEAYREADNMGIKIGGQAFHNFQRSLDSDSVLHPLKLDPTKHKNLSATFDKIRGGGMEKMTARPGSTEMNLEEFDNLRANVLKHVNSKNADERRLAGHLLQRLEGFFDQSVAKQFPKARATLDRARHNWKQYEKSKEIDTIMAVAKDRAGQYSVSGNENAIRTGFRQLSMAINRDKTGRLRRLWTRDEIAMIRRLSRGKYSPRNILRVIGKLSPNAFTLAATGGGMAGTYHTGDPGFLAMGAGGMAVGALARGAAGRLAKGKVDRLSNLVRSGGKMNKPKRVQPYVTGYVASQED